MSESKKRIFVIDGYGQIYRSYYAFMQKPLIDKNGNNVSAVYGFFNNLMMLVRQYKPDYIVVALDSKGKTFRHDLYPEYKANREKTPEDLHAQIPVIVNILDSLQIGHYARVGMEADDIIATIAKNATGLGLETVMVTGDKDLMQLVNDSVFALRPPRKGEHEYRLCKAPEVKEIFGVCPNQICDYLTILGDSSDNVPGIAGIGEKGAVKLLNEYGTLKNVYDHIEEQTASIKTKLENARDVIGLSHTLIELKNDLFTPSDFDLEDYATSRINWYNAIQEFHILGSETLVKSAKRFIDPSIKVEEKHYYPIRKESEDENIVVPDDFKVELNNPSALVGYNLKEKIKELSKSGIESKASFDVMIAAWLLDSNKGSYEFDEICDKYLGTTKLDEDEAIRRLVFILSEKLKKQNLSNVMYDMEMPLVSVLAQMENQGVILDYNRLKKSETEFTKELLQIESDIYKLCEHPFNLNSPKQLQEVLFVERKLPAGKKTKSGYSTDSDVLENLSLTQEDPVPSMLLRYRVLSKLQSTYIAALPALCDSEKRIHTTFLQTGTATGRLSSKNPNLQNIPIRTEEGRKIRDAFVPKEGCVLLSADYAQIELAILASMSEDPELCRAFKNGDDVHKQTASLIFDEFPEMVTPEQRRVAKTINFGVIYGMSAFRLANELKISRTQAQGFIDTYFARYSAITNFMNKIKEGAAKTLQVSTLFGHVRSVPEMATSNKTVRAAAERVAVNTVIQGTGAEIVKKAMLAVSKELKERNLKSRLILQVHDEIILEVPNDEVEIIKELVRRNMEGVSALSVPLRVGIETGESWGAIH